MLRFIVTFVTFVIVAFLILTGTLRWFTFLQKLYLVQRSKKRGVVC